MGGTSDTVICDLFASTTPATVAQQLRDALGSDADKLPPTAAKSPDPFEILAQAATISPTLAARADAALTELELDAVPTAEPSAYVHDVAATCRDSGRSIGVISRHQSDAVHAYFDRHGLADHIRHVSGRAGALLPMSQIVEQAVSALGSAPAQCTFVSNSADMIRAANNTGANSIGYLARTGERLTTTSPDAVILSLADLTLRLRGRARPDRG